MQLNRIFSLAKKGAKKVSATHSEKDNESQKLIQVDKSSHIHTQSQKRRQRRQKISQKKERKSLCALGNWECASVNVCVLGNKTMLLLFFDERPNSTNTIDDWLILIIIITGRWWWCVHCTVLQSLLKRSLRKIRRWEGGGGGFHFSQIIKHLATHTHGQTNRRNACKSPDISWLDLTFANSLKTIAFFSSCKTVWDVPLYSPFLTLLVCMLSSELNTKRWTLSSFCLQFF